MTYEDWHNERYTIGKPKSPYLNKVEGCGKRVSSDRIDYLNQHEVFVFGSNLRGEHAGGCAYIAYKKFGAKWGLGVGMAGQSYAIPTMQGGVETIEPYVRQFIEYAESRPDLTFLVTRIGCGIAGFKDEDIAPMFSDCKALQNVYLPEKWWELI